MSNFFSKYYARLSARNDSIAIGDASTGTTLVVNSDGSINVRGPGGGGSIPVTQGTTPWVDNITQFGNNNLSTGTGTSGLGIPRVTVSNDSNILATQSGTWNIATLTSITNPVTVNQGTSPWLTSRNWVLSNLSDSVSAVQSGTWNIATLTSITNPVTVNQGTSPWVISGATTVTGTVTANQGTSPWVVSGTVLVSNLPTTVDTNFGTIGANSLRSAAQIGNATGAALFGAGTTTAQVLRVVLPTDQTSIPVTQSGTWNIATLTSITNPVAVTQSGTWTTGRTWTLASGTDSISAVQSGTWNINNISGAITLPTGASTSVNQTNGSQKTQIVDGAGSVVGNLQTISGTNFFPVVQASSATPGSAVVARSTQVSGSDGTNARTLLTDSTGKLITQTTVTGTVLVNSQSTTPTYGVSATFTAAATATDVFTITGSSTKTIKIVSIGINGTNTGNTNILINLIKRSTANTGGTATIQTGVPFDSTDAAATAVVRSYTVNPTTGTPVGTIRSDYAFFPTLASTNQGTDISQEFGISNDKPLYLRGTSEVLAVNLSGTLITGTTSLSIDITWTEE